MHPKLHVPEKSEPLQPAIAAVYTVWQFEGRLFTRGLKSERDAARDVLEKVVAASTSSEPESRMVDGCDDALLR
jgi:hypothetical protein